MNEVLINHMYSGDYLERENIGHSIYITFKAENFRRLKELLYICDNRYENKENDSHCFILKSRSRMCGASVATYEYKK